MKLALPIEGGWTIGEHTALFPNTSFPDSGPNVAFLAEHGALPVVDWLAHDSATQRLVSVTPFRQGNAVVIVAVKAIPAAELAERQRQAELDAAVAADTTLAQLKLFTNAEFEAWFDANITTLAQLRGLIKRILRLVVRRLL